MPPESESPHGVVAVRQALRERLGLRRYQHWFETSTQLEMVDGDLVVHVQSPYLVKWVQRQFQSVLADLSREFIGTASRVRYEIGTASATTLDPPVTPEPAPRKPSVARKTPVADPPERRRSHRRAYRLTDVVMGPCNELAVSAVQQVAEDPGSLSPLYVHGAVGNGKTHLLEGLRRSLRIEHPHLQVMLLTAEQFANYFTQAYDARTLPSFRHRFRNVDVLLVDDVDFLDGKKVIQEEFLHTVKQFEQSGRQVVVTANRHPRLLTKTPEELTSRYVSGLICRIENPATETRRKIVRQYAQRTLTVRYSEKALEYVASRFPTSVRELEGAINLLSAWARMSKKRVTHQSAQQILSRLQRDCMRIVRLSDVEHAVCELFGVDSESLKSKSKKQSIAQPRMLAMFLARRMTQVAYSEIGAFFGGRNHSTVMSAEKKIAQQLANQKTVRIASETWIVQDLIETLEERIRVG